uniref:Uncharacterized protein n=1 Tax=Arundo donax TaxID=35708 RepID=A0A0A9DWE9_ARUDO
MNLVTFNHVKQCKLMVLLRPDPDGWILLTNCKFSRWHIRECNYENILQQLL